MKKLFITVLFYYLVLHVWIPWCYYKLFRFYCSYNVPESYVDQAMVLISLTLIIAASIIYLLPFKNEKIKADKSYPMFYIYIAIALGIIKALAAGNYENIIAGILSGTILAYIGIFFDVTSLLLIYLLLSKRNMKMVFLLGAYLIMNLMFSSRQSALTLVFILICLMSSENFKVYKKRIYTYGLILILISPLIFSITTINRKMNISNTNELVDQIVGRLSAIELAGTVLYQKENNLYNKQIFDEKYSMQNQIKMIANSLYPGALFDRDVDPNQYFRSVFYGQTIEEVNQRYISINSTLPGYLSMKYPLPVAIILAVLILVLFYCFCAWKPNSKFRVAISVFGLYELLYFFDWVLFFKVIYSILLTVILFNLFIYFYSFVPKLKIRFNKKIFRFNIRMSK